jgi:uncharacterized membrane protein YfcA
VPASDPILFGLMVAGLAAIAGFVGALVGLGGGAVLVPGLVLLLGVPMKTAVATSLVAVVFTSSAAAMIRGRDALTNYRMGVLLEVVAGAASVAGAVTAFLIDARLLQFVFGGTLLAIAGLSARRLRDHDTAGMPAHAWAKALALDGVEDRPDGAHLYRVQRVPAGLSIMGVAGVIAGMLGLGAGAVKVLSMDLCMGMPFRTSTVTSNFMIGATALAGSLAFMNLGLVDPVVTGPVVVGIVPGAMAGSWFVSRLRVRALRLVFLALVALVGAQMLLRALRGDA